MQMLLGNFYERFSHKLTKQIMFNYGGTLMVGELLPKWILRKVVFIAVCILLYFYRNRKAINLI